MQIITRDDVQTLKILINEFIVSHEINSKETIPIELFNYLRKTNISIEDGVLINDLCDLIEKRLKI